MTTEQIARPGTAAPRGRTRNRKDGADQPAALDAPNEADATSLSGDIAGTRVTRLEWAMYGAFTLIGALMRFWDLGSRALHHDESLHATYSWYLWEKITGANPSLDYHYDPMMHGPYQFHVNAFFMLIFGPNAAAARMNAALCGTALIILPILLRRQLGRTAALVLSGLLAFSPAFLYYSRFSREDIYFALWTFTFFIGFIRWLDARGSAKGHRWLYLAAAGFALSWATKESTYFTVIIAAGYILGVFAVAYAYQFLAPRRPQGKRAAEVRESALARLLGDFSRANMPPLLAAFKGTPWRAWGYSAAIIAVITFLLFLPIGKPWQDGFIPGYATQTTTDASNQTVSYNVDFLTGGLSYWKLQQGVSRGDQPWYYYFLIIPLYEQVAVVFGLAGFAYYALRRCTRFALAAAALFVVTVMLVVFVGPRLQPPPPLHKNTTLEAVGLGLVLLSFVPLLLARARSPLLNLILWWVVGSWGLYTYAAEKMPWLTLHLDLPLMVLAALYAGHLLQAPRLSRKWLVTVALLAVTAGISFRSSVTLAYVDGANPTEMLIYTQTSPDVPMVSAMIHRITPQLSTQGAKVTAWVDGADAWPWVWYLHDDPTYHGFLGTDSNPAAQAEAGVIGAAQQRYPVVIVGVEDHELMKNNGKLQAFAHYTPYEFKLRWWFPETGYKDWRDSTGLGGFLAQAVQPSSWASIANWWLTRTPFDQQAFNTWANTYRFYVYVRNDLVKTYVPSVYAGKALSAWGSAHLRALEDSSYTPVAQPEDVAPALVRPARPVWTLDVSSLPRPMAVARAVAVDAAGNIYLTDSSSQHVVKLDAHGRYLKTWGAIGSGPGQFSNLYNGTLDPLGIAVGPNGHVYVSDTWNGRVQEFTSDGVFVRAFGHPNVPLGGPPTADSFYGPRQLAVAPNGTIYVADTGNKRIQAYSPQGVHLFNIGDGSAASPAAPGHFDEPSGVAVDRHGIVYVADYWNLRVQRFSAGGNLLGSYPIKGWAAQDYGEPYLAVDNAGHLFATDAPAANNAHVNHVLELDAATGRLVAAFGVTNMSINGVTPGALTTPSGIAVGPDGALYIADAGPPAKLIKVQP